MALNLIRDSKILPFQIVCLIIAAGLHWVEFHFLSDDSRPAFYLNDVKGIFIFHVTPQQEGGTESLIKKDVSDITIVQSPALKNN